MAGLHTDDFGDAFQFGVFVVLLIPVNHEDHICFLLNDARLSQVCRNGTLISALFKVSVQLGQSDDRATQFFRQVFQSSGDLPYTAVHVLRV
ncbi:Uncharacterised protein [Enterobacter hormaechei]|nr:Uncharacterised protein [Enterobacter hormaechei]